MKAWKAYVREAVRILGRRPSVRALSITNEANFPISPNTSDGSFDGVREAVVKGIVAADRELRRIGRRDIELGFSVAWRWLPSRGRELLGADRRAGDEALPTAPSTTSACRSTPVSSGRRRRFPDAAPAARSPRR